MKKYPPYNITNKILKLSQSISHLLGMLHDVKRYPLSMHLRRNNKIRTIQSTLAIEGNTLNAEQVTALANGKKILGQVRDITEVKNAINIYENLKLWNPLLLSDFQAAHQGLMKDLIASNGQWRSTGVGVFKGKILAHMAPPFSRVPALMNNLFQYINEDRETPWLIKACIFHYELEFIHPFEDGNGRMGRLWQQLLLMKENPIFEYISVESVIKDNQQEYYKILNICDKAGESTEFIIFSLEQILAALSQYEHLLTIQATNPIQRLLFAKEFLTNNWFIRKDYMKLQKNISSSTASRDLIFGLKENVLKKKHNNNKTTYQYVD